MKKLVIIQILLSFLTMTAVAQIQNGDCSQYINMIDSLIKTRNLDIYDRRPPSLECELSLLDYTKGKGYLGDSIASYINRILEFLSERGTLKTNREQAINELLLRNYHFDIDANYHFHKEDFNKQALARLKSLLRKQYTDEEINRYVKPYTQAAFEDTLYISGLAYQAIKKSDITYNQAKDSITRAILEEDKASLYKTGYSINLPPLIGWFNMREFIPLLDSIQNSGKGGAQFQLALARMGNKKYQDYFLKMDSMDDFHIAFYIGTQDLIAKYGEQLYSEKEIINVAGPPELTDKIPIKYNVIIDLQNNISNFPKLIDSKFYLDLRKEIDDLPPDVVEKARQWMKENKGKYIISPNFSPYFSVPMLEKYSK